jgi:hypothetical protein
MATFTILSGEKPYYQVLVEFGGRSFEQAILSDKTGSDLDNFLQAYADEYESAYVPPLVEGV